MLIHSNLSLYFLLLLLPITYNHAQSQPMNTLYEHPKDYYLINFGLPKSSNEITDGAWRSDEDFLQTPPSTMSDNTAALSEEDTESPYDSVRIFRAITTYSIPVSSWGPKLIRLYLYPPTSTSYKNIDTTESFLSLTINGLDILGNFSGYLVSASNANAKWNTTNGLMREFCVTINEEDGKKKAINLTFSPSNHGGFGFISGIEIVSVPDGLYINRSSVDGVPYLTGNREDYIVSEYTFSNDAALENIIRLNVGGKDVQPSDDAGIRRTYYTDQNYVATFGKYKSFTYATNKPSTLNYTVTPVYTAPELVFSTMRTIGPYGNVKKKLNLTWGIEVDGGFDYLVRLHFCELIHDNILEVGQRMFYVKINEQQATREFDVFGNAGGLQIPIYRDFVTYVDKPSNASRVPLWVQLLPDVDTPAVGASLNGLEIFKLSSNGSLVAPNPALPAGMIPGQIDNPTSEDKTSHHLVPIVGGSLGVILVSVATSACFIIIYRRNKAKQEFLKAMSKQDSSKLKWLSPLDDSGSTATTASVVSSLPLELCQRFSLAQIKVATSNFDDNLIVGTGGFGKVYKGSIDGGATTVAIKRLHTSSKQGAHEFQTEIEMLSRLRHVHLVSLIGYCEDEGEMILVYEFMQRGSLRDHLMYKNAKKNNLTPLSWKQRLMTCVGSARGLHYLHAGARQLIIHRDVKSTNILLDDKWTAKVSDFGLSKAGPIPSELGPTYISTAVKGSAGYLDPEYYRRHQLTEKSDVYSFGVVLFEVLCARAAINPSLPKAEANLAVWARNHYKRGTLRNIVDPNLTGQIAPECLQKFGEIAEMCVRDRGSERPSMGDVVWVLEFALQLQETAERKNISGDGDSLEESLVPSNNNFDGGNSGNTDNDVFTSDYFSPNTNEGGGATSSGNNIDSKTTASHSSECAVDMMSGSVFSEIIDPTAR